MVVNRERETSYVEQTIGTHAPACLGNMNQNLNEKYRKLELDNKLNPMSYQVIGPKCAFRLHFGFLWINCVRNIALQYCTLSVKKKKHPIRVNLNFSLRVLPPPKKN